MVPPPGSDEARADVSSPADDPAPGMAETAALGPEASAVEHRLLERARELGTLDLANRPDAFEDLDSAIVSELRAIEDL